MCRSAAPLLKVRLQCGHGTRDGSGADGTGGGSGAPVAMAALTAREDCMALRNASDFAFQDGVAGGASGAAGGAMLPEVLRSRAGFPPFFA
eukprot:CAMPEP_0185011550 /NCGR_PEP_ID=MMETSP1098-20130426/97753_1 /TAXON_ID=89044 /ORGANISM="Spumella elongata, Strain CCAP 955/1" /LENGTH=90 /DNA_ID=CAMNT_0027540575 /DNA_START=266 /DNA_END=535 /DNA_ORIENTATION=-